MLLRLKPLETSAIDPYQPVVFGVLFPNICREFQLVETMPSDAQTFHVDLFGRFGLVSVVIFAPVLWVVSDNIPALIIGLAFFAIAEFLAYFLCTVAVSHSGIVLYRTNKARWQDMTAAKRVSFLGLPYLKVEREKGLRWWIPLYLNKPEEFRLALNSKAPVGNPLREYAKSNINDR